MKAKELRGKSEDELRKLLAETRERLRALRFNVSTAQESHVRNIRDAKKTIARILTLLNEEQPAAETK
jgi:large subunit ribosomal protein L29